MTQAIDLSANSSATSSPANIMASAGTVGYYSNIGTSSSLSTTPSLGNSVSAGVGAGALAALPPGFKTSVQQIANFQLGSYLSQNGKVSGPVGSLINGVINSIKSGNSTISKTNLNNQKFNFSSTFIPVVIQTEFNLATVTTSGSVSGNEHTSASSVSSSGAPLIIIFQSTPDSISFSKNANWNPKEFWGRPEPIQIFNSSTPVTFSLTGIFYADNATTLTSNTNLEKQLYALVTPTRNHFMPSPVSVKIGNWKRLRCIVTSLQIETKGPWFITPQAMTVPFSAGSGKGVSSSENVAAKVTSDNTAAALFNAANATAFNIASHTPYIYTVTFGFTVTSQANSVQYAEDIVTYGFNGGYEQDNATTISNFNTSFNPTSNQPTFINLPSTSAYDPTTGELTYSIVGTAGGVGTTISPATNGQFNTASYLTTLGLPTNANGAVAQGALASITSGLSSIVQTTINRNFGSRMSKVLGK